MPQDINEYHVYSNAGGSFVFHIYRTKKGGVEATMQRLPFNRPIETRADLAGALSLKTLIGFGFDYEDARGTITNVAASYNASRNWDLQRTINNLCT